MRRLTSRLTRVVALLGGCVLAAAVLTPARTAAAAVALPDGVVVAGNGPQQYAFGTVHPRWSVFAFHPDRAAVSVTVAGPDGTITMNAVSSPAHAFVAIDSRVAATGRYTATVTPGPRAPHPDPAYRVQHNPGAMEFRPDMDATEIILKPGRVSVWQVWLTAGDVIKVGRDGTNAVSAALLAPHSAALVPQPPATTPPSLAPGYVPGMRAGNHGMRPNTTARCPFQTWWSAWAPGWYALVLRNTDTKGQPLRLERGAEAGNPCSVP